MVSTCCAVSESQTVADPHNAETVRVINASHSLVTDGIADPIHLCRVLLSISLLQPEPHVILANRHSYHLLLQRLSDAIQTQSSMGYVSIATATFCLELCKKLNGRARDFVPSELVQTLEDVLEPPRIPQMPYEPQVLNGFPQLVQVWSKPTREQHRPVRSKPIPPPLR